jgi:transposase
VKNTDTAEEKGYDAGKKVSGIKRHIAVDTQGLPHAIHVTTANVTDREGAVTMLASAKDNLSQVSNILVDGGYTGEKFATEIKNMLGATVQVVKRNELHSFKVLPQRWVVERSFGWLEKCRRLWKNCERKLNATLQMVVLAFLVLLIKRSWTGSKSASAAKFLNHVINAMPFPIKSIQVDGGSEFMRNFESECAKLNIALYVLPPKRPQYNGGVERGNRTFREEFYARRDLLADSLRHINHELQKAVLKYNSYRPHFSLKGRTPFEYYDTLSLAA